MKVSFFHGLTAAVLAGISGLVYDHIYTQVLVVDFSLLVNPTGILASCVLGCLSASMGCHFFTKWAGDRGGVYFNLIFFVLTFLSLYGPFSVDLPLSIESPELLLGLIVPMHFFPIVSWLVLKPLFSIKNR